MLERNRDRTDVVAERKAKIGTEHGTRLESKINTKAVTSTESGWPQRVGRQTYSHRVRMPYSQRETKRLDVHREKMMIAEEWLKNQSNTTVIIFIDLEPSAQIRPTLKQVQSFAGVYTKFHKSKPVIPKVVQVDPQGSTGDLLGVYVGVNKKLGSIRC
ncbi:hypothetical protein EVAR_20779_1 [Eumeta japonica]|uniref:Uncharacterized protein n=1 Tax=Eumeta variegata TaxID=151549 RepID=A0A4C1UDD3_EUMVA|nr:hypothetical protein EVAR_20779_1 [Eumeta japonica]